MWTAAAAPRRVAWGEMMAARRYMGARRARRARQSEERSRRARNKAAGVRAQASLRHAVAVAVAGAARAVQLRGAAARS
eukprot:scaffold533_cov369-Prasinococcus_capsulatus_cf.AAC.1